MLFCPPLTVCCSSDAPDSKAAPTPHTSGLLVLLGSSPPWMHSDKAHTNTPESVLAKLNTKPWCTSWSEFPLYVPISVPDSFPQHSSGTDSKTGRGLTTKEKLLTPQSSCASLADRTEGFGASLCPCSQTHSPVGCGSQETSPPLPPKALTLDAGPTHLLSSLQGPLTFLPVITFFVSWVE